MNEGKKLIARERRKLLRESSQLGCDSVRYNLQIGGYGVAQRRELAFEWLREQEAELDKIRRWTLDAAVIAAATLSGLTFNVASALQPPNSGMDMFLLRLPRSA